MGRRPPLMMMMTMAAALAGQEEAAPLPEGSRYMGEALECQRQLADLYPGM
jgi:hypothetical protein